MRFGVNYRFGGGGGGYSTISTLPEVAKLFVYRANLSGAAAAVARSQVASPARCCADKIVRLRDEIWVFSLRGLAEPRNRLPFYPLTKRGLA